MTGTFIACLTPPGSAALATLALRGSRAWPLSRELFRPRGANVLPQWPSPGRFWFGNLGDAGPGDEVVLAITACEPQPHIEIHCHGGREVVRLIEQTFTQRGVVACSWQELYRHAEVPAWRVEAKEALSRTTTVRSANILLDQYHGAFERELTEVRTAFESGRREEARAQIRPLQDRMKLGRHLVEPWRVVLAGPTNVGKSSLANALAGYVRSVVSPEPGTTRDVVTTRLAIEGWPVELADTAGRRSSSDPLESAGIDRGRSALELADLVLWIFDGSTTPVFPEENIPAPLFVINKIDLPAAWDFARAPEAVAVSARNLAGIEALCEGISRRLVPTPPPALAGVPFTRRMCEEVEHLVQSLEKSTEKEGSS